jgi:rfaE bifunctional protein kinase chain/domain
VIIPPPVSADRARAIVARFPLTSVLIAGDVMLDQFVIGRVSRISPEAPVPVVEHDHDEYRIGGAGNVANNVRALGGRVELVGLVVADEAAAILTRELGARGIGCASLVVDGDRPTTAKRRIVTTRNQQVARVDYESDVEASGAIERSLIAGTASHLAQADVVVISDYLKGAVTRALVAAIVKGADARPIPVLVDPKVPHIEYYAGATVVTPKPKSPPIFASGRMTTRGGRDRYSWNGRAARTC